jgi:hypothetical protein
MKTEKVVVTQATFDAPSGISLLFVSSDSEEPGNMIVYSLSLRPCEAQNFEGV